MSEDALGGDGVVRTEMAGECFAQRRDLGSQLAFGEFGQPCAVVLAGDERLDHGPARHAEDVAGDGRQFDQRVFEELLDALLVPGTFPGQVVP